MKLKVLHLFFFFNPCTATIATFFGDLATSAQESAITSGSNFFDEAQALEEAFDSTGVDSCSENSIETILTDSIVSTDCAPFENINNALIQHSGDVGLAALQLFEETLSPLVDNVDAEVYANPQNGTEFFTITNSTNPGDLVDKYSCTRQVITNITSVVTSRRLQEFDFGNFELSFDNLLGTRSQPECLVDMVFQVEALRAGFDTRIGELETPTDPVPETSAPETPGATNAPATAAAGTEAPATPAPAGGATNAPAAAGTEALAGGATNAPVTAAAGTEAPATPAPVGRAINAPVTVAAGTEALATPASVGGDTNAPVTPAPGTVAPATTTPAPTTSPARTDAPTPSETPTSDGIGMNTMLLLVGVAGTIILWTCCCLCFCCRQQGGKKGKKQKKGKGGKRAVDSDSDSDDDSDSDSDDDSDDDSDSDSDDGSDSGSDDDSDEES